MRLNLFHLYPDVMNLYGDYGNILTIVKRCRWRGIQVEVIESKKGDRLDLSEADIIFMGGGQDRSQQLVSDDLLSKGPQIKEAIEQDVCALTICGAYQLFGHYFKTKDAVELPGIGVFDAYTEASEQRMIGNVLVDCSEPMASFTGAHKVYVPKKRGSKLVGFENHSGKTFLGERVKPLGKVINGFGNDGSSQWEGCRYRNAFGTYLHGPLLPKNPWLADSLILLALKHRYGFKIHIMELDDSHEYAAFDSTRTRILTAKTTHV